MSVPPGFVSWLMGCNPYQAHDSTPLKSVSSTTMVMSTSLGSYLAIPSSRVRLSVATMAKFFAGNAVALRAVCRTGPKEMPGFPSLWAARTMDRLMFVASCFWKMPRSTISTANRRPISRLRSELPCHDLFDFLQVLAHRGLGGGTVAAL